MSGALNLRAVNRGLISCVNAAKYRSFKGYSSFLSDADHDQEMGTLKN